MIRLRHLRGALCGKREWAQFLHGGPEGSQVSVMVHVAVLCPDCNTPHGYVDDVLNPTVMILHHDDTCWKTRGYVVEVGEEAITEHYFRTEIVAPAKARA